MVEPRYLRSQRLATTQPLPNPSRIGIQINWGKAVAETIEIRHRHAGMAKRVCCINPAGAGPGCRQESKVQFALDAQAQMIFASKARKAGDLKIQPGRKIRSSALVVLVVLSLCLPAVRPRAGTNCWLYGANGSGLVTADLSRRNPMKAEVRRRRRPLFYPNPSPIPSNRSIGDVGLQQGADEGRRQADEQGLSVCRCETGPDRNWKFWQEPYLPGTGDQQSASGKVERSAR